MRISNVLLRQHIGFMFKKHWRLQGKRTPIDTGAIAELSAKGITAIDPQEYLIAPSKAHHQRLTFDDVFQKKPPLDENHPLWNSRLCHLYGDSNVLLEGVTQAQVLTKTLMFDEFPEKIEDALAKLNIPSDVERSMQQAVLVSHLLDAQQEKTAIIKDPERPSRVFKRNYGITDLRKNQLLSLRLLNHCERLAGRSITSTRKIINDAYFVVPFEKEGDLIQLEHRVETLVTSKKPLKPVNLQNKLENFQLPDIFPLKYTVSIPQVNIYEKNNIYPLKSSNEFSHPHTILLHYSPLEVKNLFETPVTQSQFEGRALLKAFTVAAARAQSLYGANVKSLEHPITVQVVHLNGNKLQFGVFQLNTLNLDGVDGTKNFWFSKPELELYQECLYIEGRPAMVGYNRDVLKHMSVFYNNS